MNWTLEICTKLKMSSKTGNEIESAARQLVSSIQSAVYECSYSPNQNCQSNHKSNILSSNILILIPE